MPFTPVECLLGGVCIGIGAAVCVVVDGKIAGFSGILGRTLKGGLTRRGGGALWGAAFLAGTVLGGLANLIMNADFAFPEASERPWSIWAVAALCVGIGTRLGNGCTSGHGICGMSRLSWRSFVAVCTFMATGFATQILYRILTSGPKFEIAALEWPSNVPFLCGCVGLSLALAALAAVAPVLCPLVGGFNMGLGLGCAGMTSQTKVINFLNLAGSWDPSLALVMGGTWIFAVPAYAWSRRKGAPLNPARTIECPAETQVDAQLIAGQVLFGVGWALGGICPGPAIAGLVPNLALGWPDGQRMLFAPFVVLASLGWLATDAALERRREPVVPFRADACS